MSSSVSNYLNSLHDYYGRPTIAGYPQAQPVMDRLIIPANASYFTGIGCIPERQTHIIASTPEAMQELRRNEEADRQNSRNTQAAVAGVILTLAGTGLLAVVTRCFSNCKKQLNQAVDFRKHTLPNLRSADKEQLRPISEKHIEILESKMFWTKAGLGLTVATVACAVAAFVGGMFAIPWLITAAIVTGVATAAIGIFAGVWFLTEDQSLPAPMLEQIETLRVRYSA